jgi:hypothetical protein
MRSSTRPISAHSALACADGIESRVDSEGIEEQSGQAIGCQIRATDGYMHRPWCWLPRLCNRTISRSGSGSGSGSGVGGVPGDKGDDMYGHWMKLPLPLPPHHRDIVGGVVYSGFSDVEFLSQDVVLGDTGGQFQFAVVDIPLGIRESHQSILNGLWKGASS